MAIHHETHELGRLFWHSIRLNKDSPIFHRYPTHEVDYPYRWANSLIIRLPGTSYGLVVGLWHSTDRTEEQTLLEALEGRSLGAMEFTEFDKQNIQRNLIDKQLSEEDTELLKEVLDL